jgi:protein TonB
VAISADDIYQQQIMAAARDTVQGRDEVVAIGEVPSFTPFTVAPVVQNRDEVSRTLEREYPPVLRDAGVGGRAIVWLRLDEQGIVQDVQINTSSGHPALDQAALRVGQIMKFSPAMNRDKVVPVWVSVPVSFQVR